MFTEIRRLLALGLMLSVAFQLVVAQNPVVLPASVQPASIQPHCVGPDCPRADRMSEGITPVPNPQGGTTTIIVPDQPRGAQSQISNPPMPTPLEPQPASEFQEFVANAVGRQLPIYGSRLFDHVPTTFAPVDRVPVTADYIVGPGDELLVRAWGQIDVDARLTVDRGGEVYLPKVGAMRVAGLKYQQLQDYFLTAVGRVFRNFDLTVNMGQLRSIQIFVVGQARRPGAYTVSSLSTMVNALFASGGPANTGSLRHIQLKRSNQIITEFDFYDLLLKGDKSQDVRLLPGDVIYIPPVGPSIALAGSVNVPAIYELRDKTSLREAVEMAGGLTTAADGQKAIVERIENHATRTVEEFPLDEKGLRREVKDGDVVRVFSLSPRFENAVTLRGNVAEPGRYPWREGMQIRDLIPNREFLLTRAFWHQQNATASTTSIENLKNSSETREQAQMLQSVSDPTEQVQIRQTTQNRRSDWLDGNTQKEQKEWQRDLRNDVKRNAPDINWEYAVIQRINPEDLSTVLLPFNLGKAILDGGAGDNLELRAGDIVTIFSQQDMAVSLDRQSRFVRLEGEFRAPGVYKVGRDDTLRSLIERAGGLTDGAYIYSTQFTRESARVEQQKSLDQMLRQMEFAVEQQALISASRSEQGEALNARTASQHALLERFRDIKATGRVVLNLDTTQMGAAAFPAITLEDGDRILVPHRPSTVSVVGSVYNQNSFLYRDGMRTSDYLKLAGSGTRDADMKHIFVVRGDGSVLSNRTYSEMWRGGSLQTTALRPGDTVVVPAQLDKGAFMRGFRDWTQIFSQLALGAAAINVLRPTSSSTSSK